MDASGGDLMLLSTAKEISIWVITTAYSVCTEEGSHIHLTEKQSERRQFEGAFRGDIRTN